MSVVDYPVCLRLAGKPVLVVGAGGIALGRVRGFLEADAVVRVVAPRVCDELRALAAQGQLTLVQRAWQPDDLDGVQLVVSAIDDREVSAQIAAAARARGLWCTAVDQPALCDFTMPSVGRRGPITIAVSTSGKAPALAAKLRRRFEAQLHAEDLAIITGVAALRLVLPAGPRRMRFIRGVVGAALATSAGVRAVTARGAALLAGGK